MRGLPQKQNARRADKIRLCGHLGRYKKIVKKTYIISVEQIALFSSINCGIQSRLVDGLSFDTSIEFETTSYLLLLIVSPNS